MFYKEHMHLLGGPQREKTSLQVSEKARLKPACSAKKLASFACIKSEYDTLQ